MNSIIEKLRNEGVLVLMHDYRSGTLLDYSGNNNDGTPTPETLWTRRGLDFPSLAAVDVADSAELQLTAGTLIAFGDFNSQRVNERIIHKRDTGGVNYDWYLSGATIEIYDGTTTAVKSLTVSGERYLAVNFADGETPEGFADGVSTGLYNVSLAFSVDDAPVVLGNYHINRTTNYLNNVASAFLIISRKLTATEHAQLYAELEAMTWPSKTNAKSKVSLLPDLTDSSLIGAWNMKPVGNKIIDLTPNGNDWTIVGAIYEKTILGDFLNFNGTSDYLTIAHNTDFDFTASEDFALVATIKAGNQSENGAIFWKAAVTNFYYLQLGTDGKVDFKIGGNSGSNSLVSDNTFDDNLPHRIVAIRDGANNKMKLFIDGIEAVAEVSYTPNGDMDENVPLRISAHSTSPTANNFTGLISDPRLIRGTIDSDWVAKDYRRMAGIVQYKTDYGSRVSVANVTAGELENTGWRIGVGTWLVNTDTINGRSVKVFECISTGSIYIPAGQFMTPTESAYGSWEFWISHSEATSSNFYFIASSIGGGSGYHLRVTAAEEVQVTESGIVVMMKTAPGAVTANQWNKYKVTRSGAGVFTAYIDDVLLDTTGGSGSNPVTDTTTTTSKYIVLALGIGDKIAIADIKGEYSLIKKLGV